MNYPLLIAAIGTALLPTLFLVIVLWTYRELFFGKRCNRNDLTK